MEEQVKILEEKYKDIAQLKEMRENVKMLKEELIWANVRDKNLVNQFLFYFTLLFIPLLSFPLLSFSLLSFPLPCLRKFASVTHVGYINVDFLHSQSLWWNA